MCIFKVCLYQYMVCIIISYACPHFFSEDELSKLKEEFGHQQMKIDEYDALKVEYEQLHGILSFHIPYEPRHVISNNMAF